jgi:molecular chaperone GrpE (heat shock protein)
MTLIQRLEATIAVLEKEADMATGKEKEEIIHDLIYLQDNIDRILEEEG